MLKELWKTEKEKMFILLHQCLLTKTIYQGQRMRIKKSCLKIEIKQEDDKIAWGLGEGLLGFHSSFVF